MKIVRDDAFMDGGVKTGECKVRCFQIEPIYSGEDYFAEYRCLAGSVFPCNEEIRLFLVGRRLTSCPA